MIVERRNEHVKQRSTEHWERAQVIKQRCASHKHNKCKRNLWNLTAWVPVRTTPQNNVSENVLRTISDMLMSDKRILDPLVDEITQSNRFIARNERTFTILSNGVIIVVARSWKWALIVFLPILNPFVMVSKKVLIVGFRSSRPSERPSKHLFNKRNYTK